ncbi:MAG: hypothetical protein ACP5SH_09820 [Syntrophobacteraceae bacterium]
MNQQFGVIKPIIDLQKASVESLIGNLILMWEQSGVFISGAPWLPEEGRDAFRQWVDINKGACEDLKNAVDRGYSSLEKGFEKTAQHIRQKTRQGMEQVRENLDPQHREQEEHREAA